MFNRLQKFAHRGAESAFLWGARQTGKSTLLKRLFPKSIYYDLLRSDEFERMTRRPALLREELLAIPHAARLPVIIDEVQKVPALLDEVQGLITTHSFSFILSGSSARKLKRGGGNLLGGRALRYELYPLVYKEIPDFDLLRALNHGLIPRHYLAKEATQMIQAYVGDYLKEEIAAEALIRQIPTFARFLEAAAFSNGEIINYQNVARECGVSAPTSRAYFQILEDTLIARQVPSFQKRPKRRVIQAPKFYYFDVGLANFLLKRGHIAMRSEAFGKAFEHFIFQELTAHSHYSRLNYPISYWRTASGLEADFVLGSADVVIEVKGSDQVGSHHERGIRAFIEEYHVKKAIIVSMDPRPRKVGNIHILPWKEFLEQLWAGDIL